jgi:hypothetical protein
METLRVAKHSMVGWLAYAEKIGFVPDPMILCTGEIFLNGRSGINPMERSDFDVWRALQENIGGLLDFFDILVTRDVIPLISYYETFGRVTIATPLQRMLSERTCPVEVDYSVYNEVKKGALKALGQIDLDRLHNFSNLAREMDAFRYEWEPGFNVAEADLELQAICDRFAALEDVTQLVSQFLLGAFIFSGYAQASGTTHYIQPKRARFFLGLVVPPDKTWGFSNQDEDAIFATAAERLKQSAADVRNSEPIPPVLPYLLAKAEPENARALLDRALEFRESAEGKAYLQVVADIRSDGVAARRAEDAVKLARQKALAFLAPHSKLAVDRSYSLEVRLSAETVGIPFVKARGEAPVAVRVPTQLLVWWNDHVAFGGMHKLLRRMWMAADSYAALSNKLRDVWLRS